MTSLLALAIALVFGLLSTRLMKLIKLPNVTGFLLAGLLIGPYCFNIVTADFVRNYEVIIDVALGFIAFSIGAEFKLSHIKAMGKQVIVITLLQALSAVVLVDLALWAIGAPLPVVFTLGAIATATAPAATLMVVRQYRAKGPVTDTLLPVVAGDDAIGLMIFSVSIAIAKVFAYPDSAVSVSTILLDPLLEIILSLAAGAVLGTILAFGAKLFHSRGNRLCLTIACVVAGVALAEIFPLSSLLVCMMTGAVCCNIRKNDDSLMVNCDIWTPPLYMLFFVLSGAELNVTVIASVGVIGIVYLVARSTGKYFGAMAGSFLTKADKNVRNYLGLSLLPQAGVAIGMAQLAVAELPEEFSITISTVTLCATLVYELVGPVLTKLALSRSGEIGKADLPQA